MENKTISVANLLEYKDKVQEIQREIEYPFRLAFRGVFETGNGDATSKRYLSPSLQFKENGLYCSLENDMILEMKRLRPYEFNDLTALELLGKLQHFKFPTRLLDFSFSPFVALWFAVHNSIEAKNTDGQTKVYCTLVRPQEKVAALIAKVSQNLPSYDFCTTQGERPIHYIEDILFPNISENQQEENLYSFLVNIFDKNKKKSQLIFTYPHFNAAREQNQQSIFAIFFNKLKDNKGKINLESDKSVKETLSGARLIKRFTFSPEIYNPLEPCLNYGTQLPEDFYEISITGDYGNYLEELEALGINESFLFPESLEATSNDVTSYARKTITKKK